MRDPRQRFPRRAAVLLAAALAGLLCGCGDAPPGEKKLIVLGFDGMDPGLLERFMDEGLLPNFQRLRETGDFRPLATSMPPQSPVAWSDFITGMNSGGHGLFDFIHRDPETILPYLSSSRTEAVKHALRLGELVIPLGRERLVLLRRGRAFWEILEEQGVATTVMRIPANFPPLGARSLAGMGTPDIEGTYGMFTFFTSRVEEAEQVSGGRLVPAVVTGQVMGGRLYGPRHPYRRGAPKLTADFKLHIDPQHPVARIDLQGSQYILKQGEWSPWLAVHFTVIPLFQKVQGICRFYLKQVRPDLQLYVTPINIDPRAPALPISTPPRLGRLLAEELGPFYTQGMPHDTKALSAGVLDEAEFLSQAQNVFEEQVRMFERELSEFTSGLLFFYFGRTDQLSHMFWRAQDERHPAHDPDSPFRYVIRQSYIDMDAVLGRALGRADRHTTVMVVSDHGFAAFYRSFNLNTWLEREGYLVLLPGEEEAEFLQNVSWSQTRAYGYGFNSLYLNQRGREKRGTVAPGPQREALLEELTARLLAVRDPLNGQRVIDRVFRAEEIYSGPYTDQAPDLIVGYARGYRASWETALGAVSADLFRDNSEAWSGDHLVSAELVPGILLANRKISADRPALSDIAPTILAEFGIGIPREMIGRSVFE